MILLWRLLCFQLSGFGLNHVHVLAVVLRGGRPLDPVRLPQVLDQHQVVEEDVLAADAALVEHQLEQLLLRLSKLLAILDGALLVHAAQVLGQAGEADHLVAQPAERLHRLLHLVAVDPAGGGFGLLGGHRC